MTSVTAEEWDDFVERTPGGDLVQTAAWAEAKRELGFEICPILMRLGNLVVGGAHMIIKRFGPFGGVGYVARGPLLAGEYRARAAEVVDEIERAARARRVHHVIVQPPEDGDHIAAELVARGYASDAPAVAPTASLRLDLSQSLDQILSRMTATKRKGIRRGQREGLEIRVGNRSDLDLFHTLHQATAHRQGFAGMSQSYLDHHWDALHARGSVQLIFAYHGGRALAALWLTPFGDTVTQRLLGSSLEGRHLEPNVACCWGAIRWAKEHGYRYYDFGGIDRRYAELLVVGQPLPNDFYRTHHAFKLYFGPDPILLPTASQFTFNPVARLATSYVYPKLAGNKTLQHLLTRMRSR
jgi:lipid II:glycine glycyltransferase (peptidoglycan interpeptide bridge formation enzyme)